MSGRRSTGWRRADIFLLAPPIAFAEAADVISIVKFALAKILRPERRTDEDERRSLDRRLAHRLDNLPEGSANDLLVRPGGAGDDSGRAIPPVRRRELPDDALERMDREMNRERRPRRGEGGEGLASGHRRGAPRGAGQHQRLRQARQRQLALQRSGGGGEGRHARRHGIRHARLVEAARLLAHRAEYRQVAGMKPGDVLALSCRLDAKRDDPVETERGGVDDRRAGRAMIEQGLRDERAGIEADGAPGDQIAPAHRDEVGRAGPRADEMHGHQKSSERAIAQVAPSAASRAPSSFPPAPAPTRAADSAIAGTPNRD